MRAAARPVRDAAALRAILRAVRQAALIVNPRASRVTPALVRAVEGELRAAFELQTLLTERPGHAVELVEQVAPETAAIFVFSGDGGYNESINGADGSIPLGFVPGGGTSVLPRALGLPRDPVNAAHRLASSRQRRRISLGRVNGRRFAFSVGFGLDAAAVRLVDAAGRAGDGRRPGDLAFVSAFARLLWRSRGRIEATIEVGGFGRAAWVLVANGDPYTYVGRVPLHAAPAASFEGGFDVVAPRIVTAASIPRLLAYGLRGRGQTHAEDLIYAHDLDRLELRADRPTTLQADGEDLGDLERVTLEAERDALSVIVG